MILAFIPKTKSGRWSVWLIIVVPILFYIGFSFVSFYEGIPSGRTIPRDIVVRPGVALSMLAGMISGISAFITGITSITREKERALLVFVSTMMGGLLILFLLGEILFPH
jgi:hypothetical protein